MANRNHYSYTPSYSSGTRAYGQTGNRPPARSGQATRPTAQAAGPRQTAYGGARPQQRASAPVQRTRQSAPVQRARNVTPPPAKSRPAKDLILFATLLFVIPLVGLVGVFFTPVLWAFVGISVASLVFMWIGGCFNQRTRILFSLVLFVLAALALVAVIDLSVPKAGASFQALTVPSVVDTTLDTVAAGDPDQPETFQDVVAAKAKSNPALAGFMGSAATEVPGEEPQAPGEADGIAPSPTDFAIITGLTEPDASGGMGTGEAPLVAGLPGMESAQAPVNAAISGAQQALENYLRGWQEKDFEGMLNYTTQSWRNAQTAAHQQLYWNHNWWILNNWTLSTDNTSPKADSATFTVVADLQKSNSTRDPVKQRYTALVFKSEDGSWYVDPDSLRNGIPIEETPTPAEGEDGIAPQAEASPDAEPTISPTTQLWYNHEGGKFYHLEERCSTIGEQYYEKMRSFNFGDLGEDPYSKLTPCPNCKAPRKQ